VNDIRLGVVCSNDIAREGLRAILQARDLPVRALAPSLAELATETGGTDGFDLILIAGQIDGLQSSDWRIVEESFSEARLVVALERYKMETVTEGLKQGLYGIFTDDMSSDQIVCSLRLVAVGGRVVSSRILQALLEGPSSRPTPDVSSVVTDLSDREMDILKCLVAGEANKLISRRLGITEATVKVHVKAILRKLNVANRTQAAIWAVVRGFNRVEIVPEFGTG
jgi:two-component system nitrate/nitrite response regulator NarL